MNKEIWRDSLKAIYPVMISYFLLGIACGMLLYEAGFGLIAILLMSVFVFGGSAQFMVASMVPLGAAVPSIVLMAFFLNLRNMLLTSSISPYIKETSIPYLVLFSHTVGDESYAINYNEFQKNKQWDTKRAMGSNLLAFITWALSTILGGAIGSSLALNSVVMNYLLISMFVFMLVNQFVSKRFVFVGLLSGGLAVLLTIVLHNNMAIVLAAVLASCIGYLVENYQLKKTVEEGNM